MTEFLTDQKVVLDCPKNVCVRQSSYWMESNYVKVKAISEKFDKFQAEIFDDLTDRIPRLFETFNESKQSRFDTYAFMSLNFYANKKYRKLLRLETRFSSFENITLDTDDLSDWSKTIAETANCEESELLIPVILANLDERDRWYLVQRFIRGCSVEAIADSLDVHVDTVYKRLRIALKKARELLSP